MLILILLVWTTGVNIDIVGLVDRCFVLVILTCLAVADVVKVI